MDKEKGVHTQDGILFANKKKQSTDWYNVEEPEKHYAKWKTTVIHKRLHDSIHMRCSNRQLHGDIKSVCDFLGLGQEGEGGEGLLMDIEFLFGMMRMF